MREYNDQNQWPDRQEGPDQPSSPDSPYGGSGSDGWRNSSDNSSQGGQWQNGGTGSQWQQNQPGGQWQSNQSGGQWQNNQPYGQPPQRNGQALASMIFGILALVSCCIPFIQFPLAVVTIVLVILSKKKRPLSGFAIAGLVLGIISVICSICMTIYLGYVFNLLNDPEIWRMYQEMIELYQ